MATAPPNDIDSLQSQMRQVRYEMGDDVQGLVESARQLTDWQYYVRTYPWLCLGAAAAVGFLIVPPKVQIVKPDPQQLVELARQREITVSADVQTRPPGGLASRLMNMAAGMLVQGGLGLVSGQIQRYLDQSFGRQRLAGNGEGRGHEESYH